MWQSIITIDSKYTEEIAVIKEQLEQIQELYFAQQITPNRVFFNVAGKDSQIANMQIKIYSIIANIITTNIKCRFFKNKINTFKSSLSKDCLIASLVFFEQDKEYKIVRENLDDIYEYSIDGLLNFRFKELVDNWEEMTQMLLNLINSNPKESDIWSICSYLLGGRKKNQSVLVADTQIPLVSVIKNKQILPIYKLFDNNISNICASIIAYNPTQVIIDSNNCDTELCNGLKNIIPIKLI